MSDEETLRRCRRCGELKITESNRTLVCERCQRLRNQERLRKKATREKRNAELAELRALKQEQELKATGKLDDIEVAIQTQMEKGGPLGKILEDAYQVWKEGKFPGSSAAVSDSVRRDFLKLILQYVGDEGGEKELRVGLVLDAYLVCPECQKKFLPDDRVSPKEIDAMLGEKEAAK